MTPPHFTHLAWHQFYALAHQTIPLAEYERQRLDIRRRLALPGADVERLEAELERLSVVIDRITAVLQAAPT